MPELEHVFGLSNQLPGSVHVVSPNEELAGGQHPTVLYCAANNVIIHRPGHRKLTVLQGHCNPIAASAVSRDRRWAATSDTGSESLILVWELATGVPIKTFFAPHGGHGAQVLALSPDAKYLASIGGDGDSQTLCIWDWTTPTSDPVFSAPVPTPDPQLSIRFSPTSPHRLVSNGYETVHFWDWSRPESPLDPVDEFALKAQLTVTAFINEDLAVGATRAGDVPVWTRAKGGSAWTLIKTHHHVHSAGIQVLEPLDSGLIVTGGEDGFLRFFDHSFRLVTFFEKLRAGPILSISCAAPDAFLDGPRIPGLVVATAHARILHLSRAPSPSSSSPNSSQHVLVTGLVEGIPQGIACLSPSPTLPLLAIGCTGGLLLLWNYAKRTVESRRTLPNGEAVTSLAHDAATGRLLVASDRGVLRVMGDDLEDLADPVAVSAAGAVHRIAVSGDGKWIACADAKQAVAVVRFDKDTGRGELVGRTQAHQRDVVGMWFHAAPPRPGTGGGEGGAGVFGEYRLMSVGKDRMLVEYGPASLGTADQPTESSSSGISIVQLRRIEQTAVPTATAIHGDTLLVASDAWRLKTYNAHTLVCRESTLAGLFSRHPMVWLRPFTRAADENGTTQRAYLLFATHEKLLGLVALPHDGNPHRSMGVLAHPDAIADLALSHDGAFAFTAGGDAVGDSAVVKMWRLHPRALDARAAAAGGEGMAPFNYLINPTGDAEVTRHLEDLFYYAQLREDGENVPGVTHRLREKVSLAQLPALLRALGHFPSERDIEQMIAQLSLRALERVFLNYRDAVPVQTDDVVAAVNETRAAGQLGGDLVAFLKTYGEPMTDDEIERVGYLLEELPLAEAP
ncbi:hypothetical protein H9P43_006737 [Blastocladiella emersonii ATCC 22665]|nr:hypothetical protein H9P43_006737 [Blastocladiella emersonii ATCC 22665]